MFKKIECFNKTQFVDNADLVGKVNFVAST